VFKFHKRCAKAGRVSCSLDARVRSASRELHCDDGSCVLRCTTGVLQQRKGGKSLVAAPAIHPYVTEDGKE